jgi:chemotaxis protein methyltransferase CheR
MTISRAEFEYVQGLLHQRAGIVVEAGKEYLVESRLEPLARREGFQSLQDFIAILRARPFNTLHHKMVQAMTTNETFFFRDVRPFEVLRTKVIPDLMIRHAADRRLTFWCAASSTGQEPYSVAMLIHEHFSQLQGWNVRFIASDLSGDVLARAIRGCYTQLEVNRGLPAHYLVKYFTQRGDEWQIRDDIRRMIEFRELNLAEAWSFLPQMDVIFMRNVLIYFNLDTKREILRKAAQLLNPAAYLMLGSAETTLNIADEFEPFWEGQGAFYCLKSGKPS